MSYRSNGTTTVTPMSSARAEAFLQLTMFLARRYRQYSPLARLGTVHQAAFAFVTHVIDGNGVKRDLPDRFLLFTSVFDGDAAGYMQDFAVKLADEIDAIWEKCRFYPGSRSGLRFVAWLNAHQAYRDGDLVYDYFGYPSPSARALLVPVAGSHGTAAAPLPSTRPATGPDALPKVLLALRLWEQLRELKSTVAVKVGNGSLNPGSVVREGVVRLSGDSSPAIG